MATLITVTGFEEQLSVVFAMSSGGESNIEVFLNPAYLGNPNWTSYSFDYGSTQYNEIVASGIYIRPRPPSLFHTAWNDSTLEWEIDYTAFTPYLIESANNYRNQKIAAEVSYDNGTDTFTVFNDNQTRLYLVTIFSGLESAEDLSEPVPTIDFDGNAGWQTMTAADAKHLMLELFRHQQKCYSACRFVQEKHALTPYTDVTLAAMYADFDDYLATH